MKWVPQFQENPVGTRLAPVRKMGAHAHATDRNATRVLIELCPVMLLLLHIALLQLPRTSPPLLSSFLLPIECIDDLPYLVDESVSLHINTSLRKEQWSNE